MNRGNEEIKIFWLFKFHEKKSWQKMSCFTKCPLCLVQFLIELTRLNELTAKRKTAITLIRHYHANLFFVFL